MPAGHHHLRHHQHVLVDTGSYGLRIMASALAAAGLTQSDLAEPNNAGNMLAECLPFADGYTWGPLVALDVGIGGERARRHHGQHHR